jgi:signal transduction histidine kinase
MELGADDFLVKPVSLGDLLRCVEARLERAQVHWRVEDRMLSKLRGTLQSSLPHELFTPLGGIIGLADVLRAELPNLSPGEIEDFLKDIHQSALRLHRTLRNYLLVIDLQSEPEGGIKVKEKLTAERVCQSLASGIHAAAEYHGRVLDVTNDIGTCEIVSTPGDLSLIAEELVDNACKFSRKGTEIHVSFGTDGALKVRDEGRGMAPEEISQVGTFQQFDRKKHEQQGLGLGLALVQKLATRCGAEMSIKSELTKGTTIKVAFVVGNSGN